MGIPVICSNIEVFKEITNGSAIMVKNDNSSEVANMIYQLLTDENKYKQYQDDGKKNAEKFTWESMANIVLQTYKDCK